MKLFFPPSLASKNTEIIKKYMNRIFQFRNKFIVLSSLIFFYAVEVWSQIPAVYAPQQESAPEPVEDDTWYYGTLIFLFAGLAVSVYWWYATRNADRSSSRRGTENQPRQVKNKANYNEIEGDDLFDVEKEIEWLRKNRRIEGKNKGNYPGEATTDDRRQDTVAQRTNYGRRIGDLDENLVPEKLPESTFEELPINSFTEIRPVEEFSVLPVSNDTALLDAIEISQDEFEEDEKVREIALRVLESFKTRNAAECLGQMALYDLSANLRSKAVASLADLDHESVFEDILLACADPTREVRASAARGLFRLSFDRADAWARIALSKDEFRMRQAAQAALEAGLVERTFDRLTHVDKKIAYEAFTFTTLLVKAGEAEKLFKAIETHRDTKVRLALLHVLQVVKEEYTLSGLYALLEQSSTPREIKEKADEAIQSFHLVAA